MSDVVVLGSANLDLVVRQPRLPRPGETMFGSGFTTVPGGKGLNQAVAAARAGASVAFVGAVGDDENGRRLRDVLRAERVGTDALLSVAEPTGTAHISVLDDGENAIVVVPGANASQADLDGVGTATVQAGRFLLVQLERPQPLVLAGCRLARAGGATVVLTPAPVAEPVAGLLDLVDVLVPNEGEACALARTDDVVVAAQRLSASVATVVVTCGARGSLLARGGRVVQEVPAHRVEPVDTTGAGDTFVGVMVARLVAGEPLEEAMRAASVGAGLAVTRAGATGSMPRWEEIRPLLGPAST